jgi:hypothetical protein
MAKLTPKQQGWVDAFLAKHPGARVKSRKHDHTSTRSITIEWKVELDIPLFPGCTDRGRSWADYTLEVKLKSSGTVLGIVRNEKVTHYPQCILNLPVAPLGQLSLPFNLRSQEAPTLRIKAAKVSLHHPPKNTGCKLPQPKLQQQTLPLWGAVAQLHAIALRNGEKHQSTESLLFSELNGRKHLPKPLLVLLEDMQATETEKEDALRMYQVCGADGALNFVQGLPHLRAMHRK